MAFNTWRGHINPLGKRRHLRLSSKPLQHERFSSSNLSSEKKPPASQLGPTPKYDLPVITTIGDAITVTLHVLNMVIAAAIWFCMVVIGTNGFPLSSAITIGQIRYTLRPNFSPARHPSHSGKVMMRLPNHSSPFTITDTTHLTATIISHTTRATQLIMVTTTYTIAHTTSVIMVTIRSQRSSKGQGIQLHTVLDILCD